MDPPAQKTPAVRAGMNASKNFCFGEMFAVGKCVERSWPPPKDGFVQRCVAKKLEERRRVFTRDRGCKAAGSHSNCL